MPRSPPQPSTALLAVLQRRLRTFQTERIERRTANGRLLADLLRGKIFCPGADVERHNYWLFPAMVDDPQGAIAALEEAGFDVTQAQSMCVVEPPSDRLELDPVRAREALRKIILLPCYPEMPREALEKMAAALLAWQARQIKVTSTKISRTDSHRAAALRIWTAAGDEDAVSVSA